jgi:hypothetical protein
LSFPYPLRLLFANNPDALGPVPHRLDRHCQRIPVGSEHWFRFALNTQCSWS